MIKLCKLFVFIPVPMKIRVTRFLSDKSTKLFLKNAKILPCHPGLRFVKLENPVKTNIDQSTI